MRNKYFDSYLFREGMRQLRLPCLMALIFLGMESVLLPVGRAISMRTYAFEALEKMPLDLTSMNPGAYGVIVLAPFLVIAIFSFLTQRNSSDFYHSLPQTRVCLYNSYIAAVLAWCLALQLGSTILCGLICGFFPAYFEISYSLILKESLVAAATLILSTGGAALAVTLTGTLLTNILATGIILFGPRLVMLIVKMVVGGSLTVVSGDNYLEFLGNNWNVLTGVIYGIFISMPTGLLFSLTAGLYTLTVGLLYLALGLVCFHKRSSEKAGQAAVTPGLQLLFRLVPAFLFCLIPDIMVYNWLISGTDNVSMMSIYQVFILFLLSIIIYFLYELISTRKWKNLLKVAPGVIILMLVNVLTIFGMFGMQRQVLSFVPEVEDLTSISIEGENSSVGFWNGTSYVRYPGYLSNRTAQIQLTDPVLMELAVNRLRDSVNNDLNNYVDYDGTTAYKVIRFNCRNNRSYIRQIRVTTSDIDTIADILMNNEEYQNVYMNLPDAEDPALKVHDTDVDWNSEYSMELYRALQEDVAEMGFTEWYRYCTAYVDYQDYFSSMEITYKINDITYGSSFPITEKTPRAAQVYLRCSWEQEADSREMLITNLRQVLADTIRYKEDLIYEWNTYSVYGYVLGEDQLQSRLDGMLIDMADLEDTANLETLIQVLEAQSQSQGIRADGEYALLYAGGQYSIPEGLDENPELHQFMDHYSSAYGGSSYYYDTNCLVDLECLSPELREAFNAMISAYPEAMIGA